MPGLGADAPPPSLVARVSRGCRRRDGLRPFDLALVIAGRRSPVLQQADRVAAWTSLAAQAGRGATSMR
jgi:hypothetical protein